MDSTKVFIGGFSYELGENEHHVENLEELRGKPDHVTILKNAGFEKFCTSDLTVLELAGKAIDKMFQKISIAPAEIGSA